ncbi:MAG: hypothetical protein HQM00_11695 [Magnetococcales bacterium]|nr:hypothetical protein [Magnetococcales bacterium]
MILTEELPGVLGEMAQLIGRENVKLVVERFGGMRVYVPKEVKKMRVQNRLAGLLGIEQAGLLSGRFGGQSIAVPMVAQFRRKRRDEEIVRQYDAGQKVWQLARRHGLTERQIYQILGS